MGRVKRKWKVDVPTLHVRRENEVKFSTGNQNEMIYLSNARLVILKDCRHMLNIDRPDEYIHLLLSFLKSI